MLGTPKPNRARPSLGEPSRMTRLRDQSPGGMSVGSVEEVQQPPSARRGRAGSEHLGSAGLAERPLSVGASVRSGLRTRTGSSHNSREPRPVGERSYAILCARNVCDFIASRGYSKMITADKFLRDPSTKEFFEIFKFLIAQLDPGLELDGPMEQEVPQIMRRLRYPVEVNKSKLQAISGPNTWPQLLAVLDWLIVLIQLHDDVIQPIAACELGVDEGEQDVDSDHHVTRQLLENYSEYLAGKDPRAEEEKLRQIYQERSDSFRDEIDRLQSQHEQMLQQLHDFRVEHERLLELQAAPKQLEMEADRLRAAIQSADMHVQRIETEMAALESEETSLIEDIESTQMQVRALNEQVEAQEYSKQDIERLKYKREQLRKMLDDLRADGEKVEQDVWELSMKEQTRMDAISRLARRVNATVDTVEQSLVDADPASTGCQDLHVRVDFGEPTDALASLDFEEERQKAEELVKAHGKSLQEAEAVVQDVLNEQKGMQEELRQREQKCKHLRERLVELDRIKEENRLWSQEQLDDAQRAAEQSEDQVAHAAMGSAGPTVRDIAEVDELRLTLAAMKATGAQERKQLKERVARAAEKAAQHRQGVSKELEMFASEMETLMRNVVDEASGIATVPLFEEGSHGGLLRHGPRAGGC
eukprot:TRINITY_DN22349_c0_g1_i1.p1 TRINITY_DN22349_c0_g1~~TRINITY_DN22349_c0_g1_i1.p1  ORF type:complete len:646 (+),score=223.35 TRINITY_DN22349_c0_g1_i1:129-2066(+)